MPIKIKHRDTGEILRIVDAENLCGANLYGANLAGADLREADLCGANLHGSNLVGANLHGADLDGANLYRANLCGADLDGANFIGANLHGADLERANLYRANLRGANFRGADLHGANLTGVDLDGANFYKANLERAIIPNDTAGKLTIARTRILPEGDIIGWKKCRGNLIVKLRIPAQAKRSHAFGRKCRAEFADVLEIIDGDGAISNHDGETKYVVGERVMPDGFNENWREECSHGIHFFITREEAEAF